jgi:myosin-1
LTLLITYSLSLLWYSNAKQLRDYGLSVPWPSSPLIIVKLVNKFHAAFHRWRAWMVIKAIPNQDWPQLRLKVFPGSV